MFIWANEYSLKINSTYIYLLRLHNVQQYIICTTIKPLTFNTHPRLYWVLVLKFSFRIAANVRLDYINIKMSEVLASVLLYDKWMCVCVRVCVYALIIYQIQLKFMGNVMDMFYIYIVKRDACLWAYIYSHIHCTHFPFTQRSQICIFWLKWWVGISKLHVSNGVYKYWTFSWFSCIISQCLLTVANPHHKRS